MIVSFCVSSIHYLDLDLDLLSNIFLFSTVLLLDHGVQKTSEGAFPTISFSKTTL